MNYVVISPFERMHKPVCEPTDLVAAQALRDKLQAETGWAHYVLPTALVGKVVVHYHDSGATVANIGLSRVLVDGVLVLQRGRMGFLRDCKPSDVIGWQTQVADEDDGRAVKVTKRDVEAAMRAMGMNEAEAGFASKMLWRRLLKPAP